MPQNPTFLPAYLAFPGLSTPAAGPHAPFEMLAACHDRVRRSLDLLARLLQRWQDDGATVSPEVAQAAQAVARYFNLAAPHHHDDEERHVLPQLRASGQPELLAAAAQIEADHQAFRQLWCTINPGLSALGACQHPDPAEAWQAAAQAFIRLHASHLLLEDDLAFVAARQQMAPAELQAMGDDMAQRRGLFTTGSR